MPSPSLPEITLVVMLFGGIELNAKIKSAVIVAMLVKLLGKPSVGIFAGGPATPVILMPSPVFFETVSPLGMTPM